MSRQPTRQHRGVGIRFFDSRDVVDEFPPHFGLAPARYAPGEVGHGSGRNELVIVLAGSVTINGSQLSAGGFWTSEDGEEVTFRAGPDGATLIVSDEVTR